MLPLEMIVISLTSFASGGLFTFAVIYFSCKKTRGY